MSMEVYTNTIRQELHTVSNVYVQGHYHEYQLPMEWLI